MQFHSDCRVLCVFKISINNGLPLLFVPIPRPWLLTIVLSPEVRSNDATPHRIRFRDHRDKQETLIRPMTCRPLKWHPITCRCD